MLRKRNLFRLLFVLALLASSQLVAPFGPGLAAQPVVRAVLFWAEGCPHCHTVIDKVLTPLKTRYGDQLDIQMIEVSAKDKYDYFRRIEDLYHVPAERRGVPALFIADKLLVGDQEIPRELSGLIRKHLAEGGVEYPNLPGLLEQLPSVDPGKAAGKGLLIASQPGASQGQPADEEPQSNGFALANGVMVLLGLALVYALVTAVFAGLGRVLPVLPEWTDNLIPALCVIGLGVAGYLTFIEAQNVKAVCGPVGDCNAVQASPYARLFGILPVGVLGLAGYVAIVVAWVVGRFSNGRLAELAPLALFGMALFGVLFSLYLTYLELTVIYAVCIWCLSSAVIQALLLILSVGSAVGVLAGGEAAED